MAFALLPTIKIFKDDIMMKYKKKIRIGAVGGIGTPEAAAAAYIIGADFISTGSINQCTIEAGTSDIVKDMLEQINVQDTAYTPADNKFEYGAKKQVLKKGVFFPARANKLHPLYQQYNSTDEIDHYMRKQIEDKYFRCSFDEVFEKCKKYYSDEEILTAEKNPKQKMAIIFKWYLSHTAELAILGIKDEKMNFQISCGPALGAFNQWVKNTEFESWKKRFVAKIGFKLLVEAAEFLNLRFQNLSK